MIDGTTSAWTVSIDVDAPAEAWAALLARVAREPEHNWTLPPRPALSRPSPMVLWWRQR